MRNTSRGYLLLLVIYRGSYAHFFLGNVLTDIQNLNDRQEQDVCYGRGLVACSRWFGQKTPELARLGKTRCVARCDREGLKSLGHTPAPEPIRKELCKRSGDFGRL